MEIVRKYTDKTGQERKLVYVGPTKYFHSWPDTDVKFPVEQWLTETGYLLHIATIAWDFVEWSDCERTEI